MAAVIPGVVATPTRKSATTDSVTIQWTAPTDDGGDPVDDYKVYWDQGNGGSNFVLLGSSSGQTEFTKTGLSPEGSAYAFKVAPVNYIGDGPLSDPVTVLAATEPDQALAPTKTDSTKTTISIAWTAPDNGGSQITDYAVLLRLENSAGLFADITDSGTLDVSARTFTTASSLTTGESYLFKIVAINAVGPGAESPESDPIISAIPPSEP